MRRTLVTFMLVAVVAAAVPEALAGTSKTRSSRTFYVLPGDGSGECALSVARTLDARGSCWTDSFAVTPGLPSETVWMAARDGLPLSLDVARSIRGSITVRARYLWGDVGAMGAGQAQLEVTVTGVSEGEEVVVGTITSDAYSVTPDVTEYEVPFQIEPDAALAGATLSDLRLGVAIAGANVNHAVFPADGRSSVTIPVVAPRRT